MISPPVITIDGPAGTGKGTISKLLAQRLGWHYLDSGILYRVLAYTALKRAMDLSDERSLAELALNLPIELTLTEEHLVQVWLAGTNISMAVRSSEMGQAASRVSSLAKVRAALLRRQRDFRQPPGLVTDGRDMGTVIFPDALVKFFFTADLQERAQRRLNQLKLQGTNANLQDILQSLAERDQRDQERVIAPLKPAKDAIVIDTTNKPIDEVFATILVIVMSVVNEGPLAGSRG